MEDKAIKKEYAQLQRIVGALTSKKRANDEDLIGLRIGNYVIKEVFFDGNRNNINVYETE